MRWILPVALLVVALGAAGAAYAVDRDDAAESSDPAPHVVTPVLAARRVPEWLQRPGGRDRLQLALGEFNDLAPDETCLVVTDGGDPLVNENPTLGLVPGSTEKLVVSVTALDELGPDATFVTTAKATAPVEGDTIDGDLYIVGGGDPVLATAEFLDQYADEPVWTDYAALADSIAATGVTTITGNIVGDDGRYDPVRTVESWPERSLTRTTPGPLSALAVNHGFVDFPSDPEEQVTPDAADDPATHAAEVLQDLLEARGVTVEGTATSGTEPDGTVDVASLESPPLRDILRQMDSTSDNTIAELLVKELGLHRLGQGTTEGGTRAMTEILAEAGYPLEGVELHDGSGLHDENRLTCALVLEMLRRAGTESDLAAGLSVAGETGTLGECFEDDSPLDGRVRAKTGTLSETTALSGFVDTLPGQTLTFAFIGNDDSVDQDRCPPIRDKLLEPLVGFPEGPTTEDLAPRPVAGGS